MVVIVGGGGDSWWWWCDVCLLRVKYKSCGWQGEIKTSAMIYNFRLDGDTNEILFLDKTPALNVRTEEHKEKIQMVKVVQPPPR